jgi:cold shock CspA family protein
MSSIEETTDTPIVHITGQVKWFNNKAGYGFITVNSGEQSGKDIFIHYSAIRVTNSQYKYLVQGEYVEFDLVKSTSDTHEFQALNVSGINSGSLMCETRRNNDYSKVQTQPRRYNIQRDDGNRPPRSHSDTDQVDSREQREPREPREYRQPRQSREPRQPREYDNQAESNGYKTVQRTKPRAKRATA